MRWHLAKKLIRSYVNGTWRKSLLEEKENSWRKINHSHLINLDLWDGSSGELEQLAFNQRVEGSNPSRLTIIIGKTTWLAL